MVDAPGGGGSYVVRMVQPCHVPTSADADTEPANAGDVQIGAPPGQICAIGVCKSVFNRCALGRWLFQML